MNANRSKNQGPIKRLYFICGQCGFLKFRFMLKVFIFFSSFKTFNEPPLSASKLCKHTLLIDYLKSICLHEKSLNFPFFLTVLS